ncbi:MAG: 3'(2'),5'-bisphosphate nucleotidase CysQ [Alphaproteobacteria bacterium]|nr:3'(2'),5'-bisphosphate nucleotidase CysQ [Alphaproteobacteria bacterium]
MREYEALLPELVSLAGRAGKAILGIYATDFKHQTKADESPVTAADLAAEAIIEAGLAQLAPDIPLVAEEAASEGRLPDISNGRFWLVDPLDGTREFLNRNDEFTVNIALIVDTVPVLGVVHAPALALTFTGLRGVGATRTQNGQPAAPVAVRPAPEEGVTIVASRRHGDPEAIDRLLRGHPVTDRKTAGSSLKFCLVAAGEADIYPRFGRTMEWDTAAGQAVLAGAGGQVTDAHGDPLVYGKPGFENPPFIAWGGLKPWAQDD